LKADIVEESVTKDGNAFQTRAPATGKERLPIVVLRVGGTTSAGEDVDRSRCRPRDVARLIGTPEQYRAVQATVDEHGELELYPI